MSQQLGISRAAVNKAVNSLRQDGYEIESATRKGYRLLTSPDLLTEGEFGPGSKPGSWAARCSVSPRWTPPTAI